MKVLSLDIESFSSTNLAKSGVYRYSQAEDFEVLLLGYSVDSGPVRVVDLSCGEKIPAEVLRAIKDETVTKWAFNANFERVCLSRFLGLPTGEYLNPASWKCSMVWAATMGLPLSLEGVGAVLKLDKQKLTEGKDLIRYFCQPCAPTASNGQRTRNRPHHAPDKWFAFKQYNVRDVETEMAIQEKLRKFPVPDTLWSEYHLDQEINDRGVALDMELVREAISIDGRSRAKLTAAMKHLTDLENPNSVQQMKQWLADNGMETDTLGKKAVTEMLKTASMELADVLTLRQQLAKSSVRKYQAMENAVCKGGRARGMFQFYGANRTGRWAGRLIQIQNLPQNHLTDLAEARALVRSGDFEALEMLYEDVPDTLSQLIRTAFIPRAGTRFIVADFSAIEARVIAWLAGEQWRQDVFAQGGDIYCASASQMFKVPVEKHGINGHLRQKGKIAELALQYGGSAGALKSMGALEMGINEDELPVLVNAWRRANPRIVQFWWDVDHAVMEAVRNRRTSITQGITFSCHSGMLFITLPSGRQLAYVKPRVGENRFGGNCITYEGVGSTKKWERLDSYGPKFVENIVQATARDLLCYAMKTLRHCSIVMHIHDELVIEADQHMSLPFDYDMVVIDELSSFKSHQAKRFRSLMKVRPMVKRIVGLTGTPSSNGLMDLWAEFRVLDMGKRLGRFITHYRDEFFQPDKRNGMQVFSYKPKPGAEDEIYRRISDITISMKSTDYLKMPECVMNEVQVTLSDEEQQLYTQLKSDLVVTLDGTDIDAINAAALSNKLCQMANGAVYSEDKRAVHLHDRKLDALEDLIEGANGKPVLVAYWYKHDLERIQKRFTIREIKTNKDINDWNAGTIPVGLIHPASAGHGLNLQAGGATLIWFGLTWSLELYQQTNARLWRQGQVETVVIHHIITKGTIDERIMNALQSKDKTQAELIDAVKADLQI